MRVLWMLDERLLIWFVYLLLGLAMAAGWLLSAGMYRWLGC